MLKGRLAERWGHICGASKVDVVHAHARSAHHLQAAARSLEDLLRHLHGSCAASYSLQAPPPAMSMCHTHFLGHAERHLGEVIFQVLLFGQGCL